jgi:hypothetical protein
VLATLLTLLIVGFVGLIVVTVVLTILGVVLSAAFGLASILLFKVAPLLLIGWLILKFMGRCGPRGEISSADRKWLDEE